MRNSRSPRNPPGERPDRHGRAGERIGGRDRAFARSRSLGPAGTMAVGFPPQGPRPSTSPSALPHDCLSPAGRTAGRSRPGHPQSNQSLSEPPIPSRRRFGEARDWSAIFADDGQFRATETGFSRVFLAKAPGRLKTIPPAPGNQICARLGLRAYQLWLSNRSLSEAPWPVQAIMGCTIAAHRLSPRSISLGDLADSGHQPRQQSPDLRRLPLQPFPRPYLSGYSAWRRACGGKSPV